MDRNVGLESRAQQLFQFGRYEEALLYYSKCLEGLSRTTNRDVKITLIFNRSACYLKLKQYQDVVLDCNRILEIDPKNGKAQGRKIKALCSLEHFSEAKRFAEQWIRSDPNNPQARKEWERLELITKTLEQDTDDSSLEDPTGVGSPLHQHLRQEKVKARQQVTAHSQPWNQAKSGTSKRNTESPAWQRVASSNSKHSSAFSDEAKSQEERDLSWGRASNTTWDGLWEEKNVEFPALSRSSSNSSTAAALSEVVSGHNEKPTPPPTSLSSLKNVPYPGSQILSNPPQHSFGKVTFSNPPAVTNVLQRQQLTGDMFGGSSLPSWESQAPPGSWNPATIKRDSDWPLSTGRKTVEKDVQKPGSCSWSSGGLIKQEPHSNSFPIQQEKQPDLANPNHQPIFGRAVKVEPQTSTINSGFIKKEKQIPGFGSSFETSVKKENDQIPDFSVKNENIKFPDFGSSFESSILTLPLSTLDSVLHSNPCSSPARSRFSFLKSEEEKQPKIETAAAESTLLERLNSIQGDFTLTDETNGHSKNSSDKSLDTDNPAANTGAAEYTASKITQSFIPPVIEKKLIVSRNNSMTDPLTGSPKVGETVSQNAKLFGFKTVAQTPQIGTPDRSVIVMSSTEATPVRDSNAIIISSTESTPAKDSTSDTNADDIFTKGSSEKDNSTKQVNQPDVSSWKYRPPPRGLTSQDYAECPIYHKSGHCSLGDRCVYAHSLAELREWRSRFEHNKQTMKQRRQSEAVSEDTGFAASFLEKLLVADDPSKLMTDEMEGVVAHVNTNLQVNITSKKCAQTWLVTVTSKRSLKQTCLLDDTHRKQFHIASITVGPKKSQRSQKIRDHCQEWANPDFKQGKSAVENVFRIRIVFKTEIYGTFRQTVLLDFGGGDGERVISRELCVDSSPVTDLDKLTQDLEISESGRWDPNTLGVIEFQPKQDKHDDEAKKLLDTYPAPTALSISEAAANLLDLELTRTNYRARMHSLLYIEEMAQFSNIAKYNVIIGLQLTKSFMLTPANNPTARFAQSGELFARLALAADISEDTQHGRLILQNVSTVLLAPAPKPTSPGRAVEVGGRKGSSSSASVNGQSKSKEQDKNKAADASTKDNQQESAQPEKVYEAFIEEKGKNFIFLRLSAKCVEDLKLKDDMEFRAQVQFQLNRMSLSEMHLALDKLSELDLVFPPCTGGSEQPNIPWTPSRQWQNILDPRLNAKQKEAVLAITTDRSTRLPPLLLVGPYGTGKTFTLAQTAKCILQQPDTRVLVCAHSNSAADLYILEYFHPYVEAGHPEAEPLRVYFAKRWVQTVHQTVLKYCITRVDPLMGTVFVYPTKELLERYRVVVCTLGTCRALYNVGLKPGHFTHILVDEAAQALESETIMPLVLADSSTRVVLAGDHMQLSPEVHSDFARNRNLDVSLLERLFEHYPHDFCCKILLCENYRSHKAIIELTSELFYEGRLICGGKQPRHEKWYPLTFFTAQGQDTQHQNSTGFYNSAEVYEVVERVAELVRLWPEVWGAVEGAIGVLTPYADQVWRIRQELRKKKLGHVSVERVLNVQGKQFRAVFLSTVRTRHTCGSGAASRAARADKTGSEEAELDFGFLSNVKQLNTAMTRAQSLLAVVGDPVSLTSIGECRKLWERYLELCQENGSLYGITWCDLRAQLDGVELRKTYILNPNAPEFVPNRLRHGNHVPPAPIAYGKFGYAFAPDSFQGANLQAAHLPHQPTAFARFLMRQPPLAGLLPGILPVAPLGVFINPFLPAAAAPPPYVSRMYPPRHLFTSTGAIIPPYDPSVTHMAASSPRAGDKMSEAGGAGLDYETTLAMAQAKQQPVIAQVTADMVRLLLPSDPPHPGGPARAPNIGPPVEVRFMRTQTTGQCGYLLSPRVKLTARQRDMLARYEPQFTRLLQPKLGIPLSGAGHASPALSPNQLQHLQRTGLGSPTVHAKSATPISDAARESSSSPARLTPTQVEFLPKAVNVRTPPPPTSSGSQSTRVSSADVGAAGLRAGGVNSPIGVTYPHQQTSMPPPPIYGGFSPASLGMHPVLAENQFLQRELYSYIMRHDGQREADSFLRRQQQQLRQLQQHLGQVQPVTQGALTVMHPPRTGDPGASNAWPQAVLNASDLEKQWQEESVLGGNQNTGQSYTHTAAGQGSKPQGAVQYSQTLFVNPALVAHQESQCRRSSPFGDGPQPYSRLNAEQKEEWKHQFSAASSDISSSAEESPQGSPGGTRAKAPLYMRRVGASGDSDASGGSAAPGAPLKLSYAGAVRTNPPPSLNIDDIPDRTPQTVGPFTPDDHPFSSLNRFQVSSAASDASPISGDPLDILRNLSLHESP